MVTYATALASAEKIPVWIIEFPDHSSARWCSSRQYTGLTSTANYGLEVLDSLQTELDLRNGEISIGQVTVLLREDISGTVTAFLSGNDASLRSANVTLKYGFSTVAEADFQSIVMQLTGWGRDAEGFQVRLTSSLTFLDRQLFTDYKDDGFTLLLDLAIAENTTLNVGADLAAAEWPTSGHVLLADGDTHEVELIRYNNYTVVSDRQTKITIAQRRPFLIGSAGKFWSALGTSVKRAWVIQDSPIDVFLQLALTRGSYVSQINFTVLATSEGAEGYTDHDTTIYSAGVGYGWDATTALGTRDRDNPVSANEVDDSFVFLDWDQTPRVWKYDCSNGRYRVTVRCGDPSFAQEHRVLIGATVALDDVSTAIGVWVEATEEVTVTTGQLTVTIGGATSLATCINSIRVQSVNGDYDIGDGNGLGDYVDEALINITRFQDLRNTYLIGNKLTPSALRDGLYVGVEPIDSLMKYFEEEFLSLGFYFGVDLAGTLTLNPLIDLEDSATDLAGKTLALSVVPWDRGYGAAENDVRWLWDHDPSDNGFRAVSTLQDDDSKDQYGPAKLRKVESRGARGVAGTSFGWPDLDWDEYMEGKPGDYLTELANPSPPIKIRGFISTQDLEVGTLVSITHPALYSLDGGSIGVTDEQYYLTGIERSPVDGEITLQLRLRHVPLGRPWFIAPDSVETTYDNATKAEKQYGYIPPDAGNFPDGLGPYDTGLR